MGFDIVHINTHKTFTTPHGGGRPGRGPVAVTERLEAFLPKPVVGYDEGTGRCLDEDRPVPSGASTAHATRRPRPGLNNHTLRSIGGVGAGQGASVLL